MKAATNRSAKEAQIRDSFNKESFGILVDEKLFDTIMVLNHAQRLLPRNASKLHTVLVQRGNEGGTLIVNFEVLEPVTSPFMTSKFSQASEVFAKINDAKSQNMDLALVEYLQRSLKVTDSDQSESKEVKEDD